MEPQSAVEKRVDDFIAAVRARPERVVAAFGHSDFFNMVCERYLNMGPDRWLENCEVLRVTLPSASAADK